MTGGMDNPSTWCFTPRGDIIFSTTFLQNPGGGLRDGLIHAVHGGVYGKVHNVTDFHPRTGDLMPPLVHMGAAAPCGLTRYESQVFGKDTRTTSLPASSTCTSLAARADSAWPRMCRQIVTSCRRTTSTSTRPMCWKTQMGAS